MAAQITNYQCPSCTGPLHFEGKTGKLECEFCGSSFDIAEIEALYAAKDAQAQAAYDAQQAEAQPSEEDSNHTADAETEPEAVAWDVSEMSEDWDTEGEGIHTYNCPSCGAELICDATTAATSCPYCGNPTIVPGQLGGMLKPDFVLPFRLDKEAAKDALRQHYRKKVFLPRAFSSANHLEEIKGIYVPFWLFDGDADADCSFNATQTHTRTEGDYRVTTTEHYKVRRAGNMAFSRVPTDASSKMPDDYMDSLEPFDYADLKPFSNTYLPGYLADKYDISAESNAARADKRCRASAISILENTVSGYDSVNLASCNVNLHHGKVHYALLPVWTLHTKWQGKDYLFMMNGQTGKLVGDLPLSRAKFWGLFAALSVVCSGVLSFAGIGTMIAKIIFG